MTPSRRSFEIISGVVAGALLAVAYSYAEMLLPVVDPPVSELPVTGAYPLLVDAITLLVARAAPLAILMAMLAAVCSRLLKLSSALFARLVLLAWLVAALVVLPALDGADWMDARMWIAQLWYAMLPMLALTLALMYLSIRRFGYRQRDD